MSYLMEISCISTQLDRNTLSISLHLKILIQLVREITQMEVSHIILLTLKSHFFVSFLILIAEGESTNNINNISNTNSAADLLRFRGMHHMILESINSCDIDIKRQLFNNIILTGGNSLLSGFSSRLQNILNEVSPPNSKIKMIAYPASTERKFSSWIGGSILASLGSF